MTTTADNNLPLVIKGTVLKSEKLWFLQFSLRVGSPTVMALVVLGICGAVWILQSSGINWGGLVTMIRGPAVQNSVDKN